MLRLKTIAPAGAAAAYLFDPVRRRGRRARLVDQASARAKRLAEEAVRRVRYEAGRINGTVHEVGPDRDFPRDDAELLQKFRSQTVGPSAASSHDLEVLVENGEVVLKGVRPDERVEGELVRGIGGFTGVWAVRNEFTHA